MTSQAREGLVRTYTNKRMRQAHRMEIAGNDRLAAWIGDFKPFLKGGSK